MVVENLPALSGRTAHISVGPNEDASAIRAFAEHIHIDDRNSSQSELVGSAGAWPVRGLVQRNEVFFEELDETAEEYVPTLSRAYEIWRDQQHVCEQFSVPFLPPMSSQLAAISPDFSTCPGVQGLRLEAPPHMSGWWLYPDDQFNVDFAKFTTVHIFHCIVHHPNIARFLALPPNYRFVAVPGLVMLDNA